MKKVQVKSNSPKRAHYRPFFVYKGCDKMKICFYYVKEGYINYLKQEE